MKIASALPSAVLYAITRPLDHVPTQAELISYADPQNPLVWVRDERGAVGVGEALRLRFLGPGRFADATRIWREIAAAAVIDDPVQLPGTGLAAVGSFAFSSADPVASVLVVPKLVISRRHDTAWITQVTVGPPEGEPQLPTPIPPRDWVGTELPITDDDPEYLSRVRDASERISRREVEKLVLARQVRGTIGADQDLRVPLLRLAHRYQNCWTYAIDGLVGASPETLVRRADGAITARVLAGTRSRNPNDPKADARARNELLSSSKEQHEHAFAVQSVITALSPHVREMHTSEEPYALGLPNVWHLATELGAVPEGAGSSLELVAALHPTAAVAGTPTAAAVDAIDDIEGVSRGRYAGPTGWIDAKGEGEWIIALRCAKIDAPAVDPETGEVAAERRITAYAGGGIVVGSDPQREFAETVSKFAPIADAFAP